MAQFKFGDDGIGHVLADRRLSVPVYQRSYAWDEDEVSEFWSDLVDTFGEPGQEYFIGNLVFTEESAPEGAVSIIDGQQRLATTLLLLASIRDEHANRGEEEAAQELHRAFVSTYDPRTKEHRPRLHLNSEDNEFFRGLVVDKLPHDDADPQKRSHKLILSAYGALRANVTRMADAAGDGWYEQLVSLREFLETNLRVVVVDVPTEADAFLIFETLNNRGADLTIADLLKNYLYRRAGTDLDTVRDSWMQALGALEVTADEGTFVTFLRHLWSSKHGATRERDLFKGIKAHVTTRAHAVAFAGDLKKAAAHYAAILNSDHDFWRSMGSDGKANVETLHRLKLEQFRPLLLALMQHFTKAELKKALRALISWGTRGLIVGGIGGGSAERAYCDAAVGVRSGSVKNVGDLLKSLDSFVPADSVFEAAFAARRVTNAKLARYYLHSLERAAAKESQPELIPNQDEDQVNLEHIFPKNPTQGEWKEFKADEHATWVHRLGNLTLLQKGPNDRIGNKPWSDKKPVLAKSKLKLTLRAAKKKSWGKAEIDESQQHMAGLAVTAWPRKH